MSKLVKSYGTLRKHKSRKNDVFNVTFNAWFYDLCCFVHNFFLFKIWMSGFHRFVEYWILFKVHEKKYF